MYEMVINYPRYVRGLWHLRMGFIDISRYRQEDNRECIRIMLMEKITDILATKELKEERYIFFLRVKKLLI